MLVYHTRAETRQVHTAQIVRPSSTVKNVGESPVPCRVRQESSECGVKLAFFKFIAELFNSITNIKDLLLIGCRLCKLRCVFYNLEFERSELSFRSRKSYFGYC